MIYKNDKERPGVRAVWSTNTFMGDVRGFVYRMSLAATGSLRFEQAHKRDRNGASALLWFSPPDPIPRAPGTGTYIARLESDGNLAVYWKDPCLTLVWQSNSTSPPFSGCLQETTMDRSSGCHGFPWAVPMLLQETSTFTLLISTHSRFDILAEQLAYYSASPMIAVIVVTWHHMEIPPPPTTRIHGTMIRFEDPTTDSLNNRFKPLPYVTTEAVLVLDDDIKLHLQDIHNLFVVWQENKRNLVGVSPRWVDVKEQRASWTDVLTSVWSSSKKLDTLAYRYQVQVGGGSGWAEGG